MDFRAIAAMVIIAGGTIYLFIHIALLDWYRKRDKPNIIYREKLDYLEYLDSESIYYSKIVSKYERRSKKLSDIQKMQYAFYKSILTDIKTTIDKEEIDLWKICR